MRIPTTCRTFPWLSTLLVVFAFGAFAACGDDDSSPTPAPVLTSANAVATEGKPTSPVGASVTVAPTSSPTSPTASISALDGTWSGTWKASATSDNGTVRIEWKQTGSQLAGTITVSNTPCVANGTITGVVSGNTINFGAVQSVTTIAYTGTLAGNTITGTYKADASCGNATGSWTATKG